MEPELAQPEVHNHMPELHVEPELAQPEVHNHMPELHAEPELPAPEQNRPVELWGKIPDIRLRGYRAWGLALK